MGENVRWLPTCAGVAFQLESFFQGLLVMKTCPATTHTLAWKKHSLLVFHSRMTWLFLPSTWNEF